MDIKEFVQLREIYEQRKNFMEGRIGNIAKMPESLAPADTSDILSRMKSLKEPVRSISAMADEMKKWK